MVLLEEGVVVGGPHGGRCVPGSLPRQATDSQERTFRPTATFSGLTYWNLETPASKGDSVARALQWLELSRAMHAPGSAGATPRRSPRKTKLTDYSNAEGSPRKSPRKV